MFGVMMMHPALLAYALLTDAVARLRDRAKWLDRKPLVMTIVEEAWESYGVNKHVSNVDVASFAAMVTRDYRVDVASPPECGCIRPDAAGFNCRHGNNVPYHFIETMARIAHQGVMADIDTITGDLASVKSVVANYHDGMSDGIHLIAIETRKERERREREERRRELEGAAAKFAQAHNVKPASFAFIRAVERAVSSVRERRDHERGHEARMEHWAACMHSGAGSSVFFDDINYTEGLLTGQVDDLQDILAWMHDACPLLMAAYDEHKRRRARKHRYG